MLPIGPDEWQRVVDQHATNFSVLDMPSLHHKYQLLYQKSILTGDPNIPEKVRVSNG